jgi:hypothetical protein
MFKLMMKCALLDIDNSQMYSCNFQLSVSKYQPQGFLPTLQLNHGV